MGGMGKGLPIFKRLLMTDSIEESKSRYIKEHFFSMIPDIESDDVIIGVINYIVKRDELFTAPVPFIKKSSFWINGYARGENDPWVDFGPRMRRFVPSFDSDKKDDELILAWDAHYKGDFNEDGSPKLSIRGTINKSKGTILITGHGFETIDVEMLIWGKKPESV
jgi:hypothetical protein